jgi:hypothetical protein
MKAITTAIHGQSNANLSLTFKTRCNFAYGPSAILGNDPNEHESPTGEAGERARRELQSLMILEEKVRLWVQ